MSDGCKTVTIFVESNIEFTINIPNPKLTCGWLQSEVTRLYYDTLTKRAEEQHLEASQSTPTKLSFEESKLKDPKSNLKDIHNLRRNTREQRMSVVNE